MPVPRVKDQYRGYRHPFLFGIHYLGGVGDNPRTLMEQAMCELSAELRREPEWWKHFQDQAVREGWSEAARDRTWTIRTPSDHVPVQLSQNQIDYVLDELAGYAALRDEQHQCQVSCFERIWESTTLLDQPTLTLLNNEFSLLYNKQTPGRSRSEDGVTTTLIDPLLYCFIYNRTLVRHPHRPLPIPPPPTTDIYTVSPNFSLLPSDIAVSPAGTAKFLSYINNLHPTHTALYALIESALTALLPLFEHTLTDLHRNNPLMQRIQGPCRYTVWDEPDAPEHSDDEDGWATYERDMRHWVMNRPIQLPDVREGGYPGGLQRRRYRVSLRGRNLQVIVNVSETRLQPGGPSFPGSPWHVEGMRNERIVACGFYCTSMDNITDNSIQFRMAVTYPRGFSAGDTGATLRTWGLRDGDACHQYIGSVPTCRGLAVVFPNIYQHRHTPFALADPTRPGHFTVLSFFLVDPEIQPVISTARVAPQQETWIREAVNAFLDVRLPVEVVERIMEGVEGLIEEEEAEVYRKEVLAARDKFRRANDNYHFCIPFDIWNGPELVQ